MIAAFVRRMLQRAFPGVFFALVLCSFALAQDGSPVTVSLTLPEGKTSFHSGEPIPLQLLFTTTTAGYSVNTTTTEIASPIDTVIVTPMTGVFPWLDDYSRVHRYSPDYFSVEQLDPEHPVKITLSLNALYRFDQPGHYAVVVQTRRAGFGGARGQRLGVLSSNPVSFDIELMEDKEEAAIAADLETKIRSATDMRRAQGYADQLQVLTGDSSTRVKLSLYLHPKEFYPFGVDVSRGLWTARNRAMVVAALEAAMVDPLQPINTMMTLATSLKARMVVPYDATAASKALPTDAIELDYIRRIVSTLPKRGGQNLTTTSITLLAQMVQNKWTDLPEFSSVREAIITHFADVHEYNVDWVLNGYGTYLLDPRMIPALENFLEKPSEAVFGGTRAAVLKQLRRLNAERKDLAISEICTTGSASEFEALQELKFEALPEVDMCLREQLIELLARKPVNLTQVQFKASLAARFATAAIFTDLYGLYLRNKDLSGAARGALLAYLARYNAAKARPLLEEAMPINSSNLDPNVSFSLFRAYYSPTVDEFLKSRLQSGPPGQAGMAAYEMSQHGSAEDLIAIRGRLVRWREQWLSGGKKIPDEEAALESELVSAMLHAKSWTLSDSEAATIREGCLTDLCRSRNRPLPLTVQR